MESFVNSPYPSKGRGNLIVATIRFPPVGTDDVADVCSSVLSKDYAKGYALQKFFMTLFLSL
jgi:hypothetical protein